MNRLQDVPPKRLAKDTAGSKAPDAPRASSGRHRQAPRLAGVYVTLFTSPSGVHLGPTTAALGFFRSNCGKGTMDPEALRPCATRTFVPSSRYRKLVLHGLPVSGSTRETFE